jgi:hypothetical protein
MLPANQEQADRRSAVVACIDLQAGWGTTHEEDRHCAAGGTSFFYVQENIQSHFRRELNIEPSWNSRRVISCDQHQGR